MQLTPTSHISFDIFINGRMKICYSENFIKSLWALVNYEKIKLENQFYEMLTATVYHDQYFMSVQRIYAGNKEVFNDTNVLG